MNLYKISALFNGKIPYESFGGKRITIEFPVSTSAELHERFREVVGSEEESGYTFDFCSLAILEGIKEFFYNEKFHFAPLQPTSYKLIPGTVITTID